jgi:hypothetical protein
MMVRPHGTITGLPDPKAAHRDREAQAKEYIPSADRIIFHPEPVRVFSQLPLLRPSVFYNFGSTSPISRLEARITKLENTSAYTILGDSRGIPASCVSSVVLDNQGHFILFMALNACTIEMCQWLDKDIRR